MAQNHSQSQPSGTKIVGHKDGLWDILEKGTADCEIDIVAIHGVAAGSYWTWTAKVGDNRFVNWLVDPDMLPSVIPGCRVLLYGYQSNWHNDPIVTSARTIAHRLLETLKSHRKHCHERPLLFIAHSFGGIVLMKVMIEARRSYEAILKSTIGLVFFGTPFRGAEGSLINGEIKQYWEGRGDHVDDRILSDVRPDLSALPDTLDDFRDLGRKILPPCICFYEQKYANVGLLGDGREKPEVMTSRSSATLDFSKNIELERNHFNMNKFTGPDDTAYVKTKEAIEKLYRKGKKVKMSGRNPSPPSPRPESKRSTEQPSRKTFDTSPWKEPNIPLIGSIGKAWSWELPQVRRFNPFGPRPFAANISADGRHALLLSREAVSVFDVGPTEYEPPLLCRRLSAPKEEPLCAVTMGHSIIAMTTRKACYLVDSTCTHNDVANERLEEIKAIPHPRRLSGYDVVQRVALHETEQYMIVAYSIVNIEDTTIQLCRVARNNLTDVKICDSIVISKDNTKILNFSADGSRLICSTFRGRIWVWEVIVNDHEIKWKPQCNTIRPFTPEIDAHGITCAKTWVTPLTERPYIFCTTSPSTERHRNEGEWSFIAPASKDLLNMDCLAFHCLVDLQRGDFHCIMDGVVANGGNALAVISQTGHICIVQLTALPGGGIAADPAEVPCTFKNKLRLNALHDEFEGAVKFSHDDTMLVAVDKHGKLIQVPILPPISKALPPGSSSASQYSTQSTSQTSQGPPTLPPLVKHRHSFGRFGFGNSS